MIYPEARAGSRERAELRVDTVFQPWVAALVLAANVTLMLLPASVALLALAGVLR